MMTNLKVCLCVERLVEGGGEVGGVLSTLTSLALEVSNFFLIMITSVVMTMNMVDTRHVTIMIPRATHSAASL